MRNQKQRKSNKWIKGVGLYRDGRWRARITVDGKTFNLGYTRDFAEAVCLRLAAEQSLDWDGCDTSSPAFLFVEQITLEAMGLNIWLPAKKYDDSKIKEPKKS